MLIDNKLISPPFLSSSGPRSTTKQWLPEAESLCRNPSGQILCAKDRDVEEHPPPSMGPGVNCPREARLGATLSCAGPFQFPQGHGAGREDGADYGSDAEAARGEDGELCPLHAPDETIVQFLDRGSVSRRRASDE